MRIDNDKISRLINRYLSDALSDNEKQELEAWIAGSENNRKLFDEITSGETIAQGLKNMNGFDEAKWERITERLSGAQRSPLRSIRWFRNLAVAAVVSGIIAGAYLYFTPAGGFKKTTGSKQLAANSVGDRNPGKDGAILILASGEQLALDSIGNGDLTVQAGTRLVKKGGTLVWEKSSENAAVETLYNEIVTPRGRQFQITLSDGTKVWLNSASSIRFPVAFTGNKRTVEIEGEVYFEVAKMAAMPFTVKTNDVEVLVMGTHFNVNAFSDEENISTTLLEGKVEVITKQGSLQLAPGQQANLSRSRQKLVLQTAADLEKVMAWKSGFFEFDNTELQDIMRQISRWYDIDIVYEEAVTDEKFGGGISKQLPLKQVLGMLEMNGVQFRLEGNKLYVKP